MTLALIVSEIWPFIQMNRQRSGRQSDRQTAFKGVHCKNKMAAMRLSPEKLYKMTANGRDWHPLL